MALPFVNKIGQILPGFGTPTYNGAATITGTVTGTLTITIANTTTTPSAGGTAFNVSGGPAPTRGWWHWRTVNATTTATFTLEVRVTDGTNTWAVRIPEGAYTLTTGYADLTAAFNTDVSITQIIFIVILGGTATSVPMDFEVSLNP